jgi:hypothetical protein
MSQVTVVLDTYPSPSGKVVAKVDPKTGKWSVDGLIAGKTYQAVVVVPMPNLYDTLPVSIDNVTANNSTSLNFRILKKGHGLYIGNQQVTSGSTAYSTIVALLTKVDASLGAFAKSILDAYINSSYHHTFSTLQALINDVAFRALHIRAARALAAQVDAFSSNADVTCTGPLCKDWTSDGNTGQKSARGVRPSQAIGDLFSASMKGGFGFDCATAQLIAAYKAELDYLGPAAFDARYSGGIDINKSIWPGTYTPTNQWELTPGDGYAFPNPSSTNPAALNENALYLGDGLFYGHGFSEGSPAPGLLTQSQIISELQTSDPPNAPPPSLNTSVVRKWQGPSSPYPQ